MFIPAFQLVTKPLFTVLYGYQYARQNNRSATGKSLHMVPMLGAISPAATKREYDRLVANNILSASTMAYFIPLKAKANLSVGQTATPDDLIWSKSVELSSRCYTDNLEEAKVRYDMLILNSIHNSLVSTQEDATNLLHRHPDITAALQQLENSLQTTQDTLMEQYHKQSVSN